MFGWYVFPLIESCHIIYLLLNSYEKIFYIMKYGLLLQLIQFLKQLEFQKKFPVKINLHFNFD